MLAGIKPDAALIATPNRFHLEHALACVAAHTPFLLEKPVTETVADALTFVRAADATGVPSITGHHRRCNPPLMVARDFIAPGNLGRVTAVNAMWFRRKPDDYFAAQWRREPGCGPVLINAIHDIDTLRFLCGKITSVYAISSNAARGFNVVDTVSVTMTFSNGALGTYLFSDAVSAP